METQYAFAARMAELYHLLVDKLSKDVFSARVQYDYDPSLENETRLFELTGMMTEDERRLRQQIKNIYNQLNADGKKFFLYGAGRVGRTVGKWLLDEEIDFYAFCARNPEKYVDGLLGKEVFSPTYVFEHSDECYVLIANADNVEEIYNIMMEHDFPKEQIMFWIKPSTYSALVERMYFEFPELFPEGKAFVDAGCFDCQTSKRFASWCNGNYSKIFAFEPDPKNFQRCRDTAERSNLRLDLIPSGLSNQSGELHFASNGKTSSVVVSVQEEINQSCNPGTHHDINQEIVISVVALDDIVSDTEIGFIKMDIEGSEMDALRGAQRTILRDKPLLAISAYHRCGDVLAIMDYLHCLVPQYRFWLRNYGVAGTETVLYAAAL